MYEIFNRVSALFKSPTWRLNDEINKSEYGKSFWKDPPTLKDAYPSVEKVQRLIQKGADVNSVEGGAVNMLGERLTPLSLCTIKYFSGMNHYGVVPKKEWEDLAQRYFEIAKVFD